MRHKLVLIPILYIFAMFSTCTSKCNKESEKACCAAFDISKIEEHINAQNKTYAERFSTSDSLLFKKWYTKTACVYPDQNKRLCSLGEIHAYFYNGGKNEPMDFSLSTDKLYGSDEAVIEEGFYTIKSIKGDPLDNGKFIAIWKMEDDVWKIQSEIWNSDNLRTN